MMGSSRSDDEEYQFFDAHENVTTLSDSDSDVSDFLDSSNGVNGLESCSFQYNLWIRSPGSVEERRTKFFRWMGLNVDNRVDGHVDVSGCVSKGEIDRISETSGAVLRTTAFEEANSSDCCSASNFIYGVDFSRQDELACTTADLGGGTTSNKFSSRQNVRLSSLLFSDVNRLTDSQHSPKTLVTPPMDQPRLLREIHVAGSVHRVQSRMKKWCSSRLRSLRCIMERDGIGNGFRMNTSKQFPCTTVQRVKVRLFKKRIKDLSALYTGQDIQAHDGSILTMKFSPDGQYLASAGEDKIIRVWRVVEDDRSSEIDIPELDPSCVYFTVNHLSELTPLVAEKNKLRKFKSPHKTADSACVIFPPKVFRIVEKCLHEFHGHGGEILDLSWSNSNCLLSSSVDTTVRLWRVGCERCLKVFSHNNYVTCIQFNPVNDNYFLSGSIDGKVRIWAIDSCQVVDWMDVKDIVTAVTYQPDGQAGIVGSISGNCRFFSLTDNHFLLEEQMSLNSKKKSPCSRITGFQFFPQDPSKVMVTCGDSQARVLNGINVIGKYKCPRNAGNLISAFFTSDGKHIVSASDDCNVYIWSCSSHEDFSISHQKNIKSLECFMTDASVAIPWSGLKLGNSINEWQFHESEESSHNTLHFSPSACLSSGQGFFLESIPKGSATWPEEKLPSSSPRSVPLCKSHYKFFKNSCESSSSSHAWGMVIVTAGWDGRIRSFHNYGLPASI